MCLACFSLMGRLLNDNLLSGSISQAIGQLTLLSQLCDFAGASVCSLMLRYHRALENNQLSGTLPAALTSLTLVSSMFVAACSVGTPPHALASAGHCKPSFRHDSTICQQLHERESAGPDLKPVHWCTSPLLCALPIRTRPRHTRHIQHDGGAGRAADGVASRRPAADRVQRRPVHERHHRGRRGRHFPLPGHAVLGLSPRHGGPIHRRHLLHPLPRQHPRRGRRHQLRGVPCAQRVAAGLPIRRKLLLRDRLRPVPRPTIRRFYVRRLRRRRVLRRAERELPRLRAGQLRALLRLLLLPPSPRGFPLVLWFYELRHLRRWDLRGERRLRSVRAGDVRAPQRLHHVHTRAAGALHFQLAHHRS